MSVLSRSLALDNAIRSRREQKARKEGELPALRERVSRANAAFTDAEQRFRDARRERMEAIGALEDAQREIARHEDHIRDLSRRQSPSPHRYR